MVSNIPEFIMFKIFLKYLECSMSLELGIETDTIKLAIKGI